MPIIWDCDFLFGDKGTNGEDRYVLCEINVSFVAPFADAAIDPIASAALARAKEARVRRRG